MIPVKVKALLGGAVGGGGGGCGREGSEQHVCEEKSAYSATKKLPIKA